MNWLNYYMGEIRFAFVDLVKRLALTFPSRGFVGRGTHAGKYEAEDPDPKGGDVGMDARRRPLGQQSIWLAAVAMCLNGCEPRPGTLREQWESANQTFRVRAEIYDEGSLSHRLAIFDQRRCHLRLLSAPNGSDQWQQFGNAYFGPCDADLRTHVRFVGQRASYVFFQWWYRVTVDDGKTWHSWDVAAHMPGKVFYSATLIEDVLIRPDGTGTMTLNPEGVAGKVRLILHTKDFGQQWATR